MTNLAQLPAHCTATVGHVAAQGIFRERLHGMGVVPGRRVTVIRSGVPMIVDICGGRIAIAYELANHVEVVDVVEHAAATRRTGGQA